MDRLQVPKEASKWPSFEEASRQNKEWLLIAPAWLPRQEISSSGTQWEEIGFWEDLPQTTCHPRRD